MSYRVAVWSTGNIGKIAIRAISRRPDMELIAVGVHSADKVGQDAGALAGIGPVGVAATNDINEIIAARPDCVAYAPRSTPAVVPAITELLSAGINVSTTAASPLMHPASLPARQREELGHAASTGNATAFATGIEPGFAGDHLPLMFSMMSESVRSVLVQEIFRYDEYPVAKTLMHGLGFGMPMEFEPALARPEAQSATWGPSLHKVAERLGHRIEQIRCTYEKRLTPRRLEVACGTIEAGTVGAVRFKTIGVVDGHEAIVIEHVNRMADDLAPDWPVAARNGTYRVVVEGSPNLTCDLVIGRPETFSEEGRIATAMLMVNAIPYVCAAPAGLLTSLDLPFNTPTNCIGDASP